MNQVLTNLIETYLGDTGSLMLYYDFTRENTGAYQTLGGDFSTSFSIGTVAITGESAVDENVSSEYVQLYSGATILSSYTPNQGDTPQVAEDSLDPLNEYGLSCSFASNIFNFSIADTGIAQKMIEYTYNGMDFDQNEYFFGQTINFSGYIKNIAPSSTSPNYSGILGLQTSISSSSLDSKISGAIPNDSSGLNLGHGNISFGPFSGEGFLSPTDYDSEITFLFSFEKTGSEDGILFGSLRRDEFDNNGSTGVYGRGFNIGVNGRNKLFIQGIDSDFGEYVLPANSIELANKNICSLSLSPYSARFSYYNLAGDYFEEESLQTNVKIQNLNWTEPFFLGSSPTYYKDTNFPGFLDKFMVFSGSIDSNTLKSISSGFISTGTPSSGQPFTGSFITGYDYSPIYPTGITGYGYEITGYKEIRTTGELIETTISSSGVWLKEGESFYTGFSTDVGSYIEKVGFLIKDNIYRTTGDVAHATLGLKDISGLFSGSSVSYTRASEKTGFLHLYEVVGLTGFLNEPTGFISIPLYGQNVISGSENLSISLIDNKINQYKHNYLFFLSERL